MPLIKLIYAKYNSNKQCSHVHAAAQRAKLALPQKSQTAADDCQNKWHVYHTPSGPQCVEQFGSCIYILHTHTHAHTHLHMGDDVSIVRAYEQFVHATPRWPLCASSGLTYIVLAYLGAVFCLMFSGLLFNYINIFRLYPVNTHTHTRTYTGTHTRMRVCIKIINCLRK